MSKNIQVGQAVKVMSSQCIGVIIRSWEYDATVVRVNAGSIRVSRLGSSLKSESFRFCKVLSTGESLYRGGVHEIIKF